ncbi:MAG: Cna B-type domain-containing protein [Lachnospiraceae bacterium]|nr:Cna B-type domain-containing protein [Lachnospiraceae bacterium]
MNTRIYSVGYAVQKESAKTAAYRVIGVLLGLCILLAAVLLHVRDVSADEKASDCSVSIEFEGIGAEFELYRAADFTLASNGEISFALTGDFAGSKVALDDLSDEQWQTAAETLDAYAVSQKLQPMKTAIVGENGKAEFKDLPEGLYLVRSASMQDGKYTYSATRTLLTLPTTSEKPATNQSSWTRSVTIVPKVTKTEKPPVIKNYKIIKQWSGDKKDNRPKAIKVTITCVTGGDSEEKTTTQETVELNAENDWTYSWTTEDIDAEYSVDETPVPDGYTRAVKKTVDEKKNLVIFTLTNTADVPPTPTPPTTTKHVKTGDNSRLGTMLLLFIGAGCILVMLLRRSGNRE